MSMPMSAGSFEQQGSLEEHNKMMKKWNKDIKKREIETIKEFKAELYKKYGNRPKYPTPNTYEQLKKEFADTKKKIIENCEEEKRKLYEAGTIAKVFTILSDIVNKE